MFEDLDLNSQGFFSSYAIVIEGQSVQGVTVPPLGKNFPHPNVDAKIENSGGDDAPPFNPFTLLSPPWLKKKLPAPLPFPLFSYKIQPILRKWLVKVT